MAEKISTIILKVDLECNLCYKKIRKTLCKLQGRERIQSIAYDDNKNTVTISGPFDPEKLSKKLYCNAYKVIKDIHIVGSNKEKPKAQAEPAKPEKEKTKPAEPAKPPKAQAEPAKPPKAQTEPAKPDKEKPKAQPESAKPEKEKPKAPADPAAKPAKPALKLSSEPVVVAAQMTYTGYPAAWQAGLVCNCGPWYEPYYEGPGCRCQSNSYGMNYGWVSDGPPAEGPKARDFFSEEDPNSSCSIM